MGKHRKLMPTALERVIWGQGDGSTLSVLDTPLGKLGAVICWENYMPLLRAAMYAKGIELYCAPTVDDRDSWIPSMQHAQIGQQTKEEPNAPVKLPAAALTKLLCARYMRLAFLRSWSGAVAERVRQGQSASDGAVRAEPVCRGSSLTGKP